MAGNPEPARRELIVGIDYGTTSCSVAILDPKTTTPDVVNEWTHSYPERFLSAVPAELWLPKQRVDVEASASDATSQYNQLGYSHQVSGVRFGFDVLGGKRVDDNTYDQQDIIRLPKLLLLETTCTRFVRNALVRQTTTMISKGQIKFRDEIHQYIMVKVLQHAREFAKIHLNCANFGEIDVKFVLTVPTKWPQTSSMILQDALIKAVDVTGFGKLDIDGLQDLLIIHEAEAAMTFLTSQKNNIEPGDVVTIIDAGGGTVDAVTYSVRATTPLDLQCEEVDPSGDGCGSEYINQNYRDHLLARLEEEDYLLQNGEKLPDIVERLIPDFENELKPKTDLSDDSGIHRIHIPGLRAHPQKRFKENFLLLNLDDLKSIFYPCFQRIRDLLFDQLRESFAKRLKPKKVFLTGGLGGSGPLYRYLDAQLGDMREKMGSEIKLRQDTRNSWTAVAVGAALRYAQPGNGRDRISHYSFGILRKEPANRFQPGELNRIDNRYYIQTIEYFVFVGDLVPANRTWGPFTVTHCFSINEPELICEVVLYASDKARENHYALTDARNKDVRVASRALIDVTEQRDLLRVEDTDGHGRQISYLHATLEITIEVLGLNMKVYGSLKDLSDIRQISQISLATAFKPGTR